MKRTRVQEVLLERDMRRWRTLPSNIRDALEAGTSSIARLRDSIAADARVREMPLVRVHDVIVMNPERTATAEGSAGFIREGGGDWPVVHIYASAAACSNDRVLRGVLVHEFAHCFHYLAEIVLRSDRGETDYTLTEPLDVFRDEAYERETLVDPADWFGANDTAAFFHWHNGALKVIHERMIELRLLEHLPVETSPRGFQAHKILIDECVIAHARLLARQRSRS